jgi:hypothetical protein
MDYFSLYENKANFVSISDYLILKIVII